MVQRLSFSEICQDLVSFVNDPEEGVTLVAVMKKTWYDDKQIYAWISEKPDRRFRWISRLMYTYIRESETSPKYRLLKWSSAPDWNPSLVAWELLRMVTHPESKSYSKVSSDLIETDLKSQVLFPLNLTPEDLGINPVIIERILLNPSSTTSEYERNILLVLKSLGYPMKY